MDNDMNLLNLLLNRVWRALPWPAKVATAMLFVALMVYLTRKI